MDFNNKTIVITGASKGLGRTIAIHCAQKQASVVLVARTEALLYQVREEIEALTGASPLVIICDISSENDVQHMAEIIQDEFKRVDVLINNAGFGFFRVSENISNQEMRRHFEVNFFGAYYCIKALLPLLKQSSESYILNISSLFGKVALAENSVYAATKFALSGFSEGLRHELKPKGIDVGLLLPGPIKTSFHEGNEERSLKAPEQFILDPKQVAEKVENMIRRRKKQIIHPHWMVPVIKIKQRYAL